MTKIAINGFGRIGRPTLRRILDKHPSVEVVAINDLTDALTLAHLLQYDSTYGHYDKIVKVEGNNLIIDGRAERGSSQAKLGGKTIKILAEKDPANLPWKELGVDVVLECTGLFTKLEGAQKHITAGAKKVILSAPSDSPEIPTYLLGVNADKYKVETIISMGSCTTNCLAPIVKILNDNFIIEKGFMTTVHSYTNDQRILDLPHKDLRRARSAGQNIIPTSTGAAKSIGKIIPELSGKLDGISVRVPTPTVSLLDLIIEVKNTVTKEEVSEAFKKAEKENNFKGILRTDENKLVSCDYIGDSYSAIVDLSETMVNGNMIKVIAWYDNEWAYSCRLAEFCEFVGKQL